MVGATLVIVSVVALVARTVLPSRSPCVVIQDAVRTIGGLQAASMVQRGSGLIFNSWESAGTAKETES
jgi:hypothetical protein